MKDSNQKYSMNTNEHIGKCRINLKEIKQINSKNVAVSEEASDEIRTYLKR